MIRCSPPPSGGGVHPFTPPQEGSGTARTPTMGGIINDIIHISILTLDTVTTYAIM